MAPASQLQQKGFTLVESVIATAISALFLGSLFLMNAAAMDTITMARQAACASQVLQQRIESMRIANWHQVTDATWLQTNLLNADAPGADQLHGLSETLTLVPYGSSTVGNTKLIRAKGVVKILSNNTDLLGENAVKIIWTLNFIAAPNDRPAMREAVVILAKGGVAKW
jgi:prepilin-type N-terminal cleavage/methylation domain-containing protein